MEKYYRLVTIGIAVCLGVLGNLPEWLSPESGYADDKVPPGLEPKDAYWREKGYTCDKSLSLDYHMCGLPQTEDQREKQTKMSDTNISCDLLPKMTSGGWSVDEMKVLWDSWADGLKADTPKDPMLREKWEKYIEQRRRQYEWVVQCTQGRAEAAKKKAISSACDGDGSRWRDCEPNPYSEDPKAPGKLQDGGQPGYFWLTCPGGAVHARFYGFCLTKNKIRSASLNDPVAEDDKQILVQERENLLSADQVLGVTKSDVSHEAGESGSFPDIGSGDPPGSVDLPLGLDAGPYAHEQPLPLNSDPLGDALRKGHVPSGPP